MAHARVRPELRINIEGDGIEHLGAASGAQQHLQVALTHQPLLHQLKLAMEQRLWEVLPPGAGFAQRCRHIQGQLGNLKLPVRQQPPGQVCRLQLAPHLGIKSRSKGRKIHLAQRHAGRHGVAAKLADQLRMPGRNGVQRVPDMQARYRAGRALYHALSGIGKGNHRAVKTILQARSENADNALVPLGIEQAQTKGQVLLIELHGLQGFQRLLLHIALDGLAVAIQAIQLTRHIQRQTLVLGQQALDTQADIVQAPRRVQTRTNNKAQIG